MLIIDTENRCELVLRQQEEDKEVYIAPAKTFKEVVEALNFFHTKTKAAVFYLSFQTCLPVKLKNC